MSASRNGRHWNQELTLRHLDISTVWKLQLKFSRAAMSGELTSSNPGLHCPGDTPGFRCSWRPSKPKEKNQRWIPEPSDLDCGFSTCFGKQLCH